MIPVLGRRQQPASQLYLMSSRPLRDPTSENRMDGPKRTDVRETASYRIDALKDILIVLFSL